MLKNWWNTPWTWGTYVKCCVGGWVIAMIYLVTMRWWLEPLCNVYGKFVNFVTREDEYDG